MMNRWWEYQNALKPVSLSNGLGSFTRLRRNHLVANVNAISMHTTMITPVMPSTPLTSAKYVGLLCPKYMPSGAYFSSDAFMSRGKSHTRWFPAWRITPTTIAAAIVCHYKRKAIFLSFSNVLGPAEWQHMSILIMTDWIFTMNILNKFFIVYKSNENYKVDIMQCIYIS